MYSSSKPEGNHHRNKLLFSRCEAELRHLLMEAVSHLGAEIFHVVVLIAGIVTAGLEGALKQKLAVYKSFI